MNAKTAASVLRKRFSLRPKDAPYRGFDAYIGDTLVGEVGIRNNPKTLTPEIARAEIDPAFKGMGLGRKMYGEVMRRMPEGRLNSGSTVSADAVGVWKKLQANPSYDVRLSPIAREQTTRLGRVETNFNPAAFYAEEEKRLQGLPHTSSINEPLYRGQITSKALLHKKVATEIYCLGAHAALQKYAGASASPPANDGASSYRDSGSPVATTEFKNMPDELRRAFAYNASLDPMSDMADPGYMHHILQGGPPSDGGRWDTTGGIE